MTQIEKLGTPGAKSWLEDETHLRWLADDANAQFAFFSKSLRMEPGFDVLDFEGLPIKGAMQELHCTTRMVHSYTLGKCVGFAGADEIVDQGMAYLWSHHRDQRHGGYLWGIGEDGPADERKLAYGHVFVLLAGSSAKMVGHPDADRLIADVWEVLDGKYWEEANGRFADEYTRDWRPFSEYRGMNANMHGVEALLAAFEATGDNIFLERAGRILDFFTNEMASQNDWRIPEHYFADWRVDREHDGDPMFRPGGTTPGHSFEFSRLLMQYWDLSGRKDADLVARAWKLFETATQDASHPDLGGLVYTVGFDGTWLNTARYWWPVTEAIGAAAALLKHEWDEGAEALYRRWWTFAHEHMIDHDHGGWFPELGPDNRPARGQFAGKPDVYHALQATLYPSISGLSRAHEGLKAAKG